MDHQVPPHLLEVFSRDRLLRLLSIFAPQIGHVIDTDRVDQVSNEGLIMDLSWIINQIDDGQEKFVEVMMGELLPQMVEH